MCAEPQQSDELKAFTFDFYLTGAGWAEGRLKHGGAEVVLTASYLGDALGELLAAIEELLNGNPQARCSWIEEPGEFRWVFERTPAGLEVTVVEFPDSVPRRPDSMGKVVFLMTAPERETVEAIADGAQRCLDRYGVDEYQRQWATEPFPSGRLERIQARLRSCEE